MGRHSNQKWRLLSWLCNVETVLAARHPSVVVGGIIGACRESAPSTES